MGISLLTLQNGVVAIIKQITLQKEAVKRLMLAGLQQGKVVKVVQKHSNGSVTLEVNDTKVVVGRDLAHCVFVNHI